MATCAHNPLCLTKCSTIWTMAILRRIALTSYLDTVPFVYGIKHAQEWRAELLLSSPARSAELIEEGAAQACQHDIKSAAFAYAPIDDDCEDEKGDLVAEICNYGEKGIQNGIADTFKEIEKLHKCTSIIDRIKLIVAQKYPYGNKIPPEGFPGG